MKDKAKKQVTTVKTVLKNVAEFVDAVAFTAVALFSVFTGFTNREENNWYYGLLAAGLVVSIQAFALLIRHFKKG